MDSIKYILLRNSVIGVRILLFSFLNHTYLLAILVFEAVPGSRVHLSTHTAVLHFGLRFVIFSPAMSLNNGPGIPKKDFLKAKIQIGSSKGPITYLHKQVFILLFKYCVKVC